MPKCSGVLVPLLRSRRDCISRFPCRHFCSTAPRCAETRRPGDGVQSTIDAEHSALIDPNSLRNTLDAVRSANRTRLIRKVDETGSSRRLSLPDLLHIPVKGLSADAAVIERLRRPRKGNTSKENTKPPPALQRAQRKRNIDADGSAIAGQVPPLTPEWETHDTSSRFQTPWLPLVDLRHQGKQSSRSRLSAEMDAFNTYFTPSSAEQAAVRETLRDLEKTLPPQDPPWKLEVIGSRATGLASALSDIDVNIVVEGEERPDVVSNRLKSVLVLRALAKNIRGKIRTSEGRVLRPFTAARVVARARVPIVTLHHSPTGLELQIQHSNQAFNTREYAKAFVREYPNLQVLFRVLRQTLAVRGLGHGAHGGLTSYVLLNLIVASLRSHEARGGTDEIADQLLHFLDFFSEINFRSTGVVVNPFQLVERGENLPYDSQAYSMYLEDAADPTNILGRSTYRIRDVQSAMVVLRTQLADAMKAWDQQESMSPAASSNSHKSGRSILHSMLGANYRMFQLNRATLMHGREGDSGW